MFGTGLGHFIPIIAYVGFWVMCIVSLTGKPLLGLYYMMPFLPYRTMRDHFLDYPLGNNVLTILLLCVIIGGFIHGKRLPKSKLFPIWLIFGIYLYISMWIGFAMDRAPVPLWLLDQNFVTWKDYMVIPLVFLASGLVINDRKAIRTAVIIAAITLIFIDRSSLFESMTRTWTTFDEDKRGGGPLGFGSNQTAAFLAQFAMFFWGVAAFIHKKKQKLLILSLVAITIFATMYTFSRGAYAAILFSTLVLGLVKNRKILVLLGVFLLTWQAVVPAPVRERVLMTKQGGQLDESAQERVSLWENAEKSILASPILGTGFATFQFGEHLDSLSDTHNWYVKVLVETGIVGFIIVLFMFQQLFAVFFRLFRRAEDPLYRGLGLGLLLALCASAVANFFGDRWTYLEITGLFWVLVAAALRAHELGVPQQTPAFSPLNQVAAFRSETVALSNRSQAAFKVGRAE